ncbi:hypothetical protein OG780_27700 [Streptomyces sp. NBC_00386]|jgi:hypothetical protein|uniref:hypothetical protein n=1 Tax=Streptomyces sp. NBC_00386 TaxID=2975734 RepID=UPI002E1C0C3C
MISDGWPAEDATVLRYGLRRLLLGLPVGVALLAAGAPGCRLATRTDGFGPEWIPVAVTMLLGLGGVILLISRWRARRWVTAFDATGFRWMRCKEVALIRWDAPAGVGVHEAGRLRTLELRPKGETDRDDPRLWLFVRDGEPLRPDLPRLRYSVSIWPSGGRHAVSAGCLRWAPDLWSGGERVAPGSGGNPDVKGHRRRTRGTGRRPVTPAR